MGEGLRPAVQGIETIRKYPSLDGLLVPLVHCLRGNKTMHVELTPAKAPSQNGD